jgi:hypothetical protein
MPLRSAFEDLVETTLAGVAGLLGKIAYLAGLRGPGQCGYSHWGLSRIYGEEGTQQAFSEAHRSLFLQLLRTPLRTLREDVAVSSAASQISPREFVEDLQPRLPALLPQDLGGGSARHFSSVLRALSSLASQRKDSPPGATPPA